MNASKCLLTRPVLEFNYKNLATETRIVVQGHTNEIKNLMHSTIKDIIEIGQKLTHVKAHLGHGNFRNWLKLEFDWSVKTASRFMQVSENIECDNLTHLNIAVSALYLLASPSISEEVRKEALKRASQGEDITYTKAKAIVADHKKVIRHKDTLSVNSDVLATSSESESNQFILRSQDEAALLNNETTEADAEKQRRGECSRNKIIPPLCNADEAPEKPNMFVQLPAQKVDTETCLLSYKDLVCFSESKDQHSIPTEERNEEQLGDTTPIAVNVISHATLSQEIPDRMSYLEIEIKKLTPEQLALVITKSAKNGLSNSHLKAIIFAAEQALS